MTHRIRHTKHTAKIGEDWARFELVIVKAVLDVLDSLKLDVIDKLGKEEPDGRPEALEHQADQEDRRDV